MSPTRRRFLARSLTSLAGGAARGLGLDLAGGCARNEGRTRPHPPLRALTPPAAPDESPKVALGHSSPDDPLQALRDLLPLVDDLAWLRPGDRVFVKLACNSGKEHPMVTWPGAVTGMVALLKERGAGQVLVGDQSGVEHVRRLEAGPRLSSTRERMRGNGLLAAIEAAGAEPCFFDELPWDDWFAPAEDFPNHWDGLLRLPGILQRVDHVVNLPRLGAHATGGYTAGIKLAVGWLRDDSRQALHTQGDRFYERIAEISHFRPLRDKLRLTVTAGTHALLNIGPDLGSVQDLDGLLLLAARDLLAHDALAAALIPWLDSEFTSFFDIYTPYPTHADYWNRGFVEQIWGEQAVANYVPLCPPRFTAGLEHDVYLAQLATVQGRRPGPVEVRGRPSSWPAGLPRHLAGLDAGRRFVLREQA